MKVKRVFTGDDGESHFEDVTAEEMATIVNQVGTGDITLVLRPSPSDSGYHNAPRRQYVVSLSGTAEIECADGTKWQMDPGDILVAEDVDGQGHISRRLGDTQRATLIVPLADC